MLWLQLREFIGKGHCNSYVYTHSIFLGLMTKHHLVQIEPVAINAMFCVRESLSAGRRKSDAPARTTPHFMTGALQKVTHCQWLLYSKSWLVWTERSGGALCNVVNHTRNEQS
jgi:hypothetical protein